MIDRIQREWNTDYFLFAISERIPNLSTFGFASVVSAPQMYQNIAYFMANTVNESPDLVVHDNMSNREKIQQHGFDLKQSFRHRK